MRFDHGPAGGLRGNRRPVVAELRRCIKLAPAAVSSLLIYMALRSSTLYPPEDASPTVHFMWAPSYLGWYDYVLVASVAAGVAAKSIRVPLGSLVFMYALLMTVLVSFAAGSSLGGGFMAAGIVYYMRFACAFLLATGIAYRLGVEAVEAVAFASFLVLCGTALFVYSLNFGEFNRIYASAMTVASFAQMAAVCSFIALVRHRPVLLGISAGFLLLTFSRTATIALFVLLMIYVIHQRGVPLWARIAPVVCVTALVLVGGLALFKYGGAEFTGVMTRAANEEELSTLNGRLDIWTHALELLSHSRVPLAGVGFNAAPSLLTDFSLSFVGDDGKLAYPPHFHSIVIEYGFGLGVLSLVTFGALIARLAQTFKHRIYPAFGIFALFCITQSVDFTFYRPKEVILWSFLLGLADAQWRLRYRRESPSTAVRILRQTRRPGRQRAGV